jgi:hypothetical protein
MSPQEHKKHVVTQLVMWARKRGVTQQALCSVVHELVTVGVSPEHWRFPELWHTADKINKAGLRSQINFLVEIMGTARVADRLSELNVLDNFTREATAPEEPIVEETEDLDEDGDSWE